MTEVGTVTLRLPSGAEVESIGPAVATWADRSPSEILAEIDALLTVVWREPRPDPKFLRFVVPPAWMELAILPRRDFRRPFYRRLARLDARRRRFERRRSFASVRTASGARR